jgi:glycosyltransferase involved in cell wall biosynthesis
MSSGRARRLIFITQQVDPGHPALAATVPKIRALAERCDEVVVLADRVIPGTLPGNCRSLSFASATRPGRGLRFEAALSRELSRKPRPSAVLAHMCPIYAVLAAPLARPLGVKVVLWFTHWKETRTLRLAERLSNSVVTVDRRSFPLDSPKVEAIGHGIDLAEFARASAAPRHEDFRAVALGRYSRAKGLETVIRAAGLAGDRGLDLRLEVFGPALNVPEREHRAELERLVAELGLEKRVALRHAVLRAEVPEVLARADVLVNNMEAGAPDKVVYEAAASARPVLASNRVFDELFAGLEMQLEFPRDDPERLADRLAQLAALPGEERIALGEALRERVAERHSVQHWADRILEVVAE